MFKIDFLIVLQQLKMETVNKTIDELDLRKWVVKSEEKNEVVDHETLLWRFECENEFWSWNIDFVDDIDCHPGILGMNNLRNKHDETFFQAYLGDLLVQNTSLGTRNNLIFLLKCRNLKEYFDKRFSKYEKLEFLLRKYYTVRVPEILREMHFNLNYYFHSARKLYRIELFDLNDPDKEICVLIPLSGEPYKNSADGRERKYFEDNGEYLLYIYLPINKMNQLNKDNGANYDIEDWNFREMVIYHPFIPYYSVQYGDCNVWSKKIHHFFCDEDKGKVLQLLLIHRLYFSHIDKNIFYLLIEKLSQNFSESLTPLLSEISKIL